MSKILGLDVGDSKIGIAMSDAMGWVAQGVTTLRRQNMQQDLHYLRTLIHDNNVKEIVVGLPVKKNGQADAQTNKTLRFAGILRQHVHIPVRTWDERFTTIQAGKILEHGHVKKKKKAALIDKVAAVIILQGYLDNRNYEPEDDLRTMARTRE